MKNKSNFDIVFDGFNFVSGLLAFSSLKAGMKVAFKNVGEFSLKFEPEISGYYPHTFSQTLCSAKNYSFIRGCSSLFPHLFMPQRVLKLSTAKMTNSNFHRAADKLLSLERESATLPINIGKYNVYKPLENVFSKGLLVFEYRFDRQRALIELFQLCKNLGATIYEGQEFVTSEIQFSCAPYNSANYTFTLSNFIYIIGNYIRISAGSFDLTIQTVLSDTHLNIYFKRKSVSFDDVKTEFFGLFEMLNMPSSEELKSWLKQAFQFFMLKKNSSDIIEDGLGSLRSAVALWEKKISKQVGKRIRLKNAVVDYSSEEMTYDHFRKIQSECDEKFDLAKQTGISYTLFRYMFFRYRPNIDQMIERAYEIVNQERDAQIAWRKTEEDFFLNKY